MLRETTRQMLAHAKSSLTEFEFAVLELYILKGQPVQQVARVLASTPNSVQKTASNVRKKLKGQIHF
jgi:DNA-binding NarL/FixJ family response regulator